MGDPDDVPRVTRVLDYHVDLAFPEALLERRKESNLCAKSILDTPRRRTNQEVDVATSPLIIRPGAKQPNLDVVAERICGGALDFTHLRVGQPHSHLSAPQGRAQDVPYLPRPLGEAGVMEPITPARVVNPSGTRRCHGR
jgi:hypothetical protein